LWKNAAVKNGNKVTAEDKHMTTYNFSSLDMRKQYFKLVLTLIKKIKVGQKFVLRSLSCL